jgi:methylated-DNA-[protein]-cysteine S-methyltransferase
MSTTHARTVDTPIGRLTLWAEDDALVAVDWPGRRANGPSGDADLPILCRAAHELSEYFASARTAFTVPLRPAGTPFQRQVWDALAAIPYGHTRSYAGLARAIGRPAAVRAVGAANARNPLPLFIPCHRVLGADGRLTGFAGGLPVKAALLALEKAKEPRA